MALPNGTWSQLERRRLWVYSLSSIKRRMTLEFAHNVTFCRAGESASECFMSEDSLDISFGISPPVSTGQPRQWSKCAKILTRITVFAAGDERWKWLWISPSVPIVASIAFSMFSSDRSSTNANVCSCQVSFTNSLRPPQRVLNRGVRFTINEAWTPIRWAIHYLKAKLQWIKAKSPSPIQKLLIRGIELLTNIK